jgi:hypothetical protein
MTGLFLSLVWLSQDVLQVLAMGFFLIPDLFLLGLLAGIALFPPRGSGGAALIWSAFGGGLLWDLRWTSLPGLTASTDAAAVALVLWIWGRTPPSGRNAWLFSLLALGAHFCVGAIRFAASADTPAALRMALVQQLTAVPIVALLALLVAIRGNGSHA